MTRLAPLMILMNFFIPGSIGAENYPNWEGYPPMFSINDVIEFSGFVYGTPKGVCSAIILPQVNMNVFIKIEASSVIMLPV